MDMDEHAWLQCELRGKYKSVREEVGVDVHTPYRYAHANSTSETEQRDRRCLRSETPSETNVLPPDVPALALFGLAIYPRDGREKVLST